jgi:MtN3 and saliva related transmembrane protein
MPIDLVGYLAAILTTIAFVPQALTSWRTRNLSGVSLPMYSIFTVGVAMWLAYGVMLGSWPLIAANAITLALSGTVLALKVMQSRDQAFMQSGLLSRELDVERSRAQAAIDDNTKLSYELAAMTDAVERKSAAMKVLEAKVADLESRGK